MEDKTTNTQMFKCWAQYIFLHFHLSVVDHWEKLKCIQKILQPTNFRMFLTRKEEHIDEESK
jgi:hypothetical protein